MSSRYQLPSPFEYIDYHTWFADAFTSIREVDPAMTHRKMSELCGYKSSGAIALIASGERRMSPDSAKRAARGLKLNAAERDHLLLLIAFEAAESHEERQRLLQRMANNERFAKHWGEALQAYVFYSKWYHPVVWELLKLKLPAQARVLSQQVLARFSPKQAQQALATLERLKLVKFNPEQEVTELAAVEVPHEVHTELFRHHQKDMTQLAVDAIDWHTVPERYMRATTYATSRAQAMRVKARLAQAQREIDEILAEESEPELVFQLNTQWFPLTSEEDG